MEQKFPEAFVQFKQVCETLEKHYRDMQDMEFTVDMDVRFSPQTANLRRCGLVCLLDSTLTQVDYYAHGPWENYVDRKDACPVGRYTLDANDTGKYVKPQSMGNREGLRSMLS